MSKRRNNIRNKFKSFCKHSTLHGFYYFSTSSRWTVHLLWSSTVISSLILCTFLSQMIWQKFIIDPTFTLVESTRYSIEDIPFPAVALCDTGVVYGPNTMNITEILYRRGYDKRQVRSFFRSLIDVQHVGFTPVPYLLRMHALMEDLGYTYDMLIETIRKPCHILLMECIWRTKIFNCSDMFRKIYTFRGYCCQFDIPYFRSHAENVSFISGVQRTEGLELRINGDYYSSGGKDYEGRVLLYLFDSKDSITLIDDFITLTARTYYDVNLEVWAIDSSENVKALTLADRKCLLDYDDGADFYQGCLTREVLQRVVANCRCLPFKQTAADLQVQNYSQCLWDGLFCVYSTLEKTLAGVKTVIEESGCYQRCDYIQYDTTVKYIRERRQNGHITDNFIKLNTSSWKGDNSSRLLVHFADNTCMKYRREVLYTWDQVLANFGGIFGLCVGGSIISIIELIWFLIDVFFTLILPEKTVSKNKSIQKDFEAKLSPKFKKNFGKFGKTKLAFVN